MSQQSDTDEPIDGSTRRSVIKSAAAGTGLVLFGSTAGAASAQSTGLGIDGPSEIVYGRYNVFEAVGASGASSYIWNHDKYSDNLKEEINGPVYKLKPVDRDLIGTTVEIFLTVDGETVTRKADVVESNKGEPVPIGSESPQDLNGDGLYRDVNGDGDLSIADAQLLFDNLDSSAVQNYSEYYNFSGDDPSEVTIFDVRALYNQII